MALQSKILIEKEYESEFISLIDSGVYLNCIQEWTVPTKYFEKSKQDLSSASGSEMKMGKMPRNPLNFNVVVITPSKLSFF